MDNLEINTTTESLPAPALQAHSKRSRGRKVGKWASRFVLALCLLFGFYFSVTPAGRAAVRSFTILPDILAAAQPDWQKPVAEPIEHTQATIPSSAGTVYLDVYEPSTSTPLVPGSREGVLVIPGVGDERKEPQVINFSETLAHAGMVVMDMTTPTLIDYRMDAGDKEAVIQAFHALQHWPTVGAERVGMFGISAGGALMCLAAADARIRDQVDFVAILGGYFNTTTLLEALGRRALDVDGKLQPWQSADVPKQTLSRTIAPYLPGSDGQAVESAFEPVNGHALTSAQLAALAPESAAVYHLLAGDQPGQVAANLAALPSSVKALLAGLSPSGVASQIRAPIYLLHDRNDQYVPVTESRAFAAALARLHHPYDFAEFGIFQHADVRSNVGVSQLLNDGQNLFRLISEVAQAGS